MKKKFGVLAFCLQLVLVSSIPVIAASGLKNISVNYRNIKIIVGGIPQKNDKEPFIYDNTTYVPLRFISESLGGALSWDDKTNTISIFQTFGDTELEAIEIVGKDYREVKIIEPISYNGEIYYYMEMKDENGVKSNAYYYPKLKTYSFFLEVNGG